MPKPHKPSTVHPAKKHHPTKSGGGATDPTSPTSPGGPPGGGGTGGTGTTSGSPGDPVFGQPTPSPDPTSFKDPVTDAKEPDVAGVQPVPQPASGAAEPVLTLAQVYGSQGTAKTQAIQSSGQIVFHSVGDTGSVKGPGTQSLVADKMISDFSETNAADVPSFYYHLGAGAGGSGQGQQEEKASVQPTGAFKAI